MKIDGRCHCGYVSFEAEADPETTTICNCTDCQTMSGAPFRAVIITQPGTFVLFRKTTDIERPPTAETSPPRILSALWDRAVFDGGYREPKAYPVWVGVVRQRNELVPRRQGFIRSQQAWVNDIASMPKFDAMPPR